MKKNYIYLVKNLKHTLFKVGYTSSQNPLNRIRNYISHNPEIQLIDIWEVPSKDYEKLVQYEIGKTFPKCKIKGQQEWFLGNIFKFEITNMIYLWQKIDENNLKKTHKC